jgi:hypothetical protein
MMTLVFVVLAIGILLVLAWLLFSPQWKVADAAPRALDIEKLQNLHCRHFPQIGQILRKEDLAFMQRVAPASLNRKWKRDRARILRRYLNRLKQDLAQLEGLARLLAALTPATSRKQEWEWLKLGIQFRILFALVAIRIRFGSLSFHHLARLTELIVVQATALEIRVSQIADVLPARI